ncbi:MAG: hypothetical protein QOE54_350 [Streptosporangiaceae bacterium]|jgi:DNA-binding PadR family transcriptional regulator|nr:hypothetical protein [Streptosporangiaceae bacterium]
MALRHAVLAALLDGEHSGYELTKIFDVSVSNFWHALPQQLYAELTKLEQAGLITGRQVIQQDRPNKRMFSVTEAGIAELQQFAAASSKPSFIPGRLDGQGPGRRPHRPGAGDQAARRSGRPGHSQDRAL